MVPTANAQVYDNRPMQALQTALDMETHFPNPMGKFLNGHIFTGLPLSACSARPSTGAINVARPQPTLDPTPDRSHHRASATRDEVG